MFTLDFCESVCARIIRVQILMRIILFVYNYNHVKVIFGNTRLLGVIAKGNKSITNARMTGMTRDNQEK